MHRPKESPGRRWPWVMVALPVVVSLTPGCEPAFPPIDPAVVDRPLPGPDTPIDPALAEAGRVIYDRRCLACHKLGGGDLVGPDLAGVTGTRDPGWLRGIILSPDSMLREDPEARELLARFVVPMPDTELDEAGFRAVLEYLRSEAARLP